MPDSCIDGVVRRRADKIRVGDRVDLEGDPYADPDMKDDGTSGNPEFKFEFAEVESIEFEPHDTDPCIVLNTTQGSFGFPPDWEIEVDGEQIRENQAEDIDS